MTIGASAGGDHGALDRLLGGPDISWLVDRVRARILGAHGEPMSGTVVLPRPTDAQRAAVARLLGARRRSSSSLRVELGDVEQVLRRGPWPAGLADAVITLTGPVVDKHAERAREDADWARAVSRLDDAAREYPGLGEWWQQWCSAGHLKRVARAEAARCGVPTGPNVAGDLVAQAARVLAELPVSAVPLAVLAGQVLGDAHALDDARPLGRLAVTVVGAAFSGGAPASARETWARAGVVRSNVASTVLALGVPGAGAIADGSGVAAATATALEALRGARAPMVLTLDQVRSGGVVPLPADALISVCENPTIVEVAAARWAVSAVSGCVTEPVLVCTSGQPSTAVVELLTILSRDGATVRYHGDFDWAGLRIAAGLADRVPWMPWRFCTADYTASISSVRSGVPLSGGPADAPWDENLKPAMCRAGLAIEEEIVVDSLVADLLGGA